MHEVSRIFPGSNLASDAPCGSSSASAPTPTTAPTSITPKVHYRLCIRLVLIFRWLLLLVLRAQPIHNRRGNASNIWVPAGLSVWVEQDKMQRIISTMGITNPP
jgi:hypothetical protein